jgi:hypothetical protein
VHRSYLAEKNFSTAKFLSKEYEIDTAGRAIEDGSTINAIFKILGDRYARKILESLIDSPKSALDISKECKISLTLVYEKIKNLKNMISYKFILCYSRGKKICYLQE